MTQRMPHRFGGMRCAVPPYAAVALVAHAGGTLPSKAAVERGAPTIRKTENRATPGTSIAS